MCLIAYLKNKSFADLEALESAQENNPHGWGIMYAKDGRLHICRKNASFSVFKEALAIVPDNVPIGIHFRWATHGDKSENNIHPFDILTHEEDGVDVCMMHNGVISGTHSMGTGHSDKRSDTALYVEYVLRPMFKEAPRLMYNTGFQSLVSRDIGSGNKFLFMDGKGGAIIINPSSGHFPVKDSIDVWYSNTYSLTPSYRPNKVGKATYDSSLSYQRKDTATQHVVPAPNPVPGHWEKNKEGVWEKRERHWHTDTHETTKYGGRYTNSPPPRVQELSSVEVNVPKYITDLLINQEKLLSPVRKDGTMLGFGWITTRDHLVSRWDEEICKQHKRWYNERIAAEKNEKKEDAKVADLGTAMEAKFDSADFRQMSPAEVLHWVDRNPKAAAEWVVKHGFFGSTDAIEQFIISGDGWEDVSEFIHDRSRNANSDVTLFQKALDDHAQNEMFDLYHPLYG